MDIHTSITEYFRLTPIQKIALKKLGVLTVLDLMYHFPVRYGDTAEARSIDSLKKGDVAVIFGKITGLKASKGFKTKMTMATAYVEDETGRVQCVWFNQPYIAKMTPEGALVRIEGKVSQRRNKPEQDQNKEILYFSNPKIEVIEKLPIGVGDSLFGNGNDTHNLYPVYPESRGITSTWIYHAMQKIFKSGALEKLEEMIPDNILEKYHLPSLKTAIVWMHAPRSHDDALSARKRFSFEEIFIIQIGKRQARREYEQHPSFLIESNEKHLEQFIKRFPFKATEAQMHAIQAILADMKRGQAMSRLLEGDVGSGKTAVAAATVYAVITSQGQASPRSDLGKFQVAYMCPTEILATQHFESFIQYFAYLGIQIGLMTGSGCRKFPSKVNPKGWTDISRTQLLKWVANGEISVLIGTHALIQPSVKFKNLAYTIIDEQHRFGMAQRRKLVQKNMGAAPHLLSMTATPIPRTLALTMYGDLDLTLLDQSPAGRKPIITELVVPAKREEMYAKIRVELQAGRQLYVICPRINEPDPDKEATIIAKSVKEEARRLKESVFPEYKIGILHSKMKPVEKDAVMAEFKNGKTHILCATSVVEVGVNVPNATNIIIEGAERFGLAQLHQLRGRVMRSSYQPYCYAFTETKSEKSIARLQSLKTAKNGFELAELDLSARGAGELSGVRQWGISDVAMEALKNLKMVEVAREEATCIVDEDLSLKTYPILKKEVEKHAEGAHFE